MQLKATKSAMPMKVAQRIDVSKFMSYIKVKQLSHKKGGNDFLLSFAHRSLFKKNNNISVI